MRSPVTSSLSKPGHPVQGWRHEDCLRADHACSRKYVHGEWFTDRTKLEQGTIVGLDAPLRRPARPVRYGRRVCVRYERQDRQLARSGSAAGGVGMAGAGGPEVVAVGERPSGDGSHTTRLPATLRRYRSSASPGSVSRHNRRRRAKSWPVVNPEARSMIWSVTWRGDHPGPAPVDGTGGQQLQHLWQPLVQGHRHIQLGGRRCGG